MSIQHSNDIKVLRDRCEKLEDRVKALETALAELAARKKPGPKPKLGEIDFG